ncbi:MAG: ATP-dependent zinc metalloprotease FtsH [Phycisphaerae bacterium]
MRVPRGFMSWAGFILMALMVLALMSDGLRGPTKLNIGEFWAEAEAGNVEKVVLTDNAIRGVLKQGRQGSQVGVGPQRFEVKYPPTAIQQELIERLQELARQKGFSLEYDETSGLYFQLFLSIIPWLLILLFVWFFVFRQLRSASGGAGILGNFGRSRHRVINKEMTNLTFADVAGIEEAKEEVHEIVEFLRNPKRFQRLGGRIPRGVLLVGDPGCGKTLLAKAIAGEADVPFFSISGADFVEMFVGVGASRVRDLFRQAKENAPCIIFLDEIDAVGRRRGAGYNGGHDEREQTLNAILVEMDGFDTSDQVIVIAATNREDVLDTALTRPGRFDRRVYVPLPDIRGRLEILKVHAKKVKLRHDVDLMRLARGTPMYSGAELAAIINEAALIATLVGKDAVDMDDLEEARDKVRYGRSNKSRTIEEKERVATAYHEAGHAVLQMILPNVDPLHKVTIIPRGHSLGSTMSLPEKDRYGYGQKWLQSTIRVLCGGRIAEHRITDDVSSGAAMDIQMATRLARAMVLEWGMSDKLGFVKYSPDDTRESLLLNERPYSDETAHVIDDEVRRLTDEAFRDAERLVAENWEKINLVAQALLKHETLDREDIERLFRGESLNKVSLSGLIENESAPLRRPDNAAPKPNPQPDLPGGALPQPG